MSRVATERLTARLYKERLKRTGRLPASGEVRQMELEAVKTAQKIEGRRKR